MVTKVDDGESRSKDAGALRLAQAIEHATTLWVESLEFSADADAVARVIVCALEELAGERQGDSHQRALGAAAIAVRSELLRSGEAEFAIASDDYASIRAALLAADRPTIPGVPRELAFAQIALELEYKGLAARMRAAQELAREFRGNRRYSSESADGAANRQRRALRTLLECVYGFERLASELFVKRVFTAPAKAKRRAAARARKP